ncbi:outer membrane beta-barrel protein [Thalassotalea crassostreae]|uniref:outer membrane beta-barrel protein n=1 Tax=Thalassotalea crassostreae TaxID=1763536 RepID=UPI000837C5DE|nr:outer membrane beta-barrel protein [Thalassotalea crassostreae]
MKKLITALTLTLTAAIAAPAMAEQEPNIYVGANISHGYFNEDSKDEIDFSNAIVRFGYQFDEHIATELRVGQSLSETDYDGYSQELDGLYGGYLKLGHKMSDKFSVYMLAGVSNVEITTTTDGGGSYTQDTTSASFGSGIEYTITDNLSINTEVMAYSISDAKFGTFGFGATYAF